MMMSVGVFVAIMMMKRNGEHVENIKDLSGVAKSKPIFAALMTAPYLTMAQNCGTCWTTIHDTWGIAPLGGGNNGADMDLQPSCSGNILNIDLFVVYTDSIGPAYSQAPVTCDANLSIFTNANGVSGEVLDIN